MFSKALEFEFEKETPGTVRFIERPKAGRSEIVGHLYIKKSALGDERPARVFVIIEAGD